MLHPFFALLMELWHGRSRYYLGQAYLACGCGGRQVWLNRACPYGQWGPLTPIFAAMSRLWGASSKEHAT